DLQTDCCPDSRRDYLSLQTNKQLRRRDHSLHDRDLLVVLSTEVAIIESHEEGAETRAENERAAGEDQRVEAERSASERFTNGTAAADEGRQSARRLFAATHSDAVPVCALSRYHD